MKCRLLLDIVVRESSTILELFARKDKPLLVGWDPLLILDFGLDILNAIRGLTFQSNSFTGKSFHENLHYGIP